MNNFIKLLFSFCILLSFHVSAQPFITKWNLDTLGSGPTQLTFNVETSGVTNYTWETIPAGQSGSGTFSGSTFNLSGLPVGATIRLSIGPTNFNRIFIDNGLDKKRLLDIEQWGNVIWSSMQYAFNGCSNLNISATDVPNLTALNDMSFMFGGCKSLNGPANMNQWNTSSILTMGALFYEAIIFNQDISNWNTSNVITMNWMFHGATNFNQSIGTWNTSNVADMNSML
jgi:surface protein